MTKSIMSNERECYVCGTPLGLHRHHIFFGTADRRKSEQYGCWVYLCGAHHNLSNQGVHYNHVLDLELKQKCQAEFEKIHSHEEFMKVFRRNYR